MYHTRYHHSGSQIPNGVGTQPTIQAELGEDVVLLSPLDSSVVINPFQFQGWSRAETDDDVLVMNADMMGNDRFLFAPDIASDGQLDNRRSANNRACSNNELQYLLDQLPAPDAAENSLISDSSSSYRYSVQRTANYAEECESAPLKNSHIGQWHFAVPAEEKICPNREFQNNMDSRPAGLNDVEELRVLVRAREREVGEEREKAELMERACEAAKLEVE